MPATRLWSRLLRTALPFLAVAVAAPAAHAEPVQQIDVRLTDVRPDGRYAVDFSSNSFDTEGAQLPGLTRASVRIPRSIRIKPRFLRPDRLCDVGRLSGILIQTSTPARTYGQMLGDLPRARRRVARLLSPNGRTIFDRCLAALWATGTVTVDARPRIADPIPGRISLFLTKPTTPKAVVGVGIMSTYDVASPLARPEKLVRSLQPISTVNVFDEPSTDGQFGYRVQLLPDTLGVLGFSVAELHVRATGLSDGRGGTGFWIARGACPASGKLPFRAEYAYETGLRSSSAVAVPCPRFVR